MSTKIFLHRSRKIRRAPPHSIVAHEAPEAYQRRVKAERAERESAARSRQHRRAAARETRAGHDKAVATTNALAKAAFPWSRIKAEIRVLDRIIRPSAEAPVARYGALIRGRLFALHHIFGSAGYEAATRWMTGAIDPETWEIVGALCPVTTSGERLEKIVDFFLHWDALLFEQNGAIDSRRIIETTAEITRCEIAERIEAAREARGGLTLHPLGDDWFLIRTDRATRLVWRRLGSPFGNYETAIRRSVDEMSVAGAVTG